MNYLFAFLLLSLSLLLLAWFFHLITHDPYPDSFKFILMIYVSLFALEFIIANLNQFSGFRDILPHREFLIFSFGPLFISSVLFFAASFLLLLASLDSSFDDFSCFRKSLISFLLAIFLLGFCALSLFLFW